MKLITGATGHLGSTIIKNLLQTEVPNSLAVLVRDRAKAADLIQAGVNVRFGDYNDSASLEQAFQGVSQLVLISSNDFKDRFGQHQRVVDAAVNAGVKHILYTGVSIKSIVDSPLRPLLEDHFQTEDYIKASGIAYTFLQHSLYAEVVPLFLGPQVLETGVFFPAGSGSVPFATRADLAEAIATILRSQGHENKTYRMTHTEQWSFDAVGQFLSELHQTTIPYVSPSPEVYTEVLRNAALPEEMIQMSLAFGAAIAHHDFEETFSDLEQILGRKPTDLKSFLKESYGL